MSCEPDCATAKKDRPERRRLSAAAGRRGALVAVVGLLGCAHALAGQRLPATLSDPLLALAFDPHRVHFAVLPPMPPKVTAGSEGPRYLFAKAADGDATVYVAGGFERQYQDCDAKNPNDCPYQVVSGFGVIVRVRGREVKVLGTPDLLNAAPGQRAPLTDALADALWRDAAKRFAQAFGGRRPLLAQLQRQGLQLDTLDPAFVEALQASK